MSDTMAAPVKLSPLAGKPARPASWSIYRDLSRPITAGSLMLRCRNSELPSVPPGIAGPLLRTPSTNGMFWRSHRGPHFPLRARLSPADRHRENPARPSDPHILGHRARHPQDPPGLHDRPAHHRRFISAHPKGRHRRTGRPGRLSQPRHIPARHQALALVDATAIVTTKTPIRLIQNNFVSPNLEVGLEAASLNLWCFSESLSRRCGDGGDSWRAGRFRSRNMW